MELFQVIKKSKGKVLATFSNKMKAKEYRDAANKLEGWDGDVNNMPCKVSRGKDHVRYR